MKVAGSGDVFDPAAYKAAITNDVRSGFVRIKFKKIGVDGLKSMCA